MSIQESCIFCGDSTGSREHTFPAGLGGRRVNKGILCGDCNNRFSGLDAVLIDQLRALNGLLGVVPDRKKVPTLARVSTATGQVVIDEYGKPALPGIRILDEDVDESGKGRVTLVAGNEQQWRDHVARERAAGRTVKEVSRNETRQYIQGGTLEFKFGGPECFRAVGRVALNFLTGEWPTVGRADELRPFKDYVQGMDVALSPVFVWYTDETSLPLPPCKFSFGHTIALFHDHVSGGLYARVCFYDTLEVWVHFGCIAVAQTRAKIIHINPLSKHPPDDIYEEELSLAYPMPTVPSSHPPLASSGTKHRLAALFQRIEDRQWALNTHGLVDALNSTRSDEKLAQQETASVLLCQHKGRVLALAQHSLQVLKSQNEDATLSEVYGKLEQDLCCDPSSETGLSDVGMKLLDYVFDELLKFVCSELKKAPLTDTALRNILSRTEGVRIAGMSVIAFAYLTISENEDSVPS